MPSNFLEDIEAMLYSYWKSSLASFIVKKIWQRLVETKNAFIDIKSLSRRIGDVRTFNGSILEVRQMSTSLAT